MAMPGIPTEFAVTKSMYESARRAYGQCAKCREKLNVFKQLGYDYPDIETQLNEWQPRMEAVMSAYTEQLGNGNQV